jgi:ribosomal protein L37AE/L43A
MNSITNLLPTLQKDFPDIKFEAGENFSWWPRDQKIIYSTHQSVADHGVWSLLHEVAHAILSHNNYTNDFDLLKMENLTWRQARILGKKYGISIDADYVQDCLDSYRDWLHNRAKCPKCGVVSLQRKDGKYQCFNCLTTWRGSQMPLPVNAQDKH